MKMSLQVIPLTKYKLGKALTFKKSEKSTVCHKAWEIPHQWTERVGYTYRQHGNLIHVQTIHFWTIRYPSKEEATHR